MLSARLALAKKPVVADAVEALGQHVQQEAPDELVIARAKSWMRDLRGGKYACPPSSIRTW
jgi:hypothetical protein